MSISGHSTRTNNGPCLHRAALPINCVGFEIAAIYEATGVGPPRIFKYSVLILLKGLLLGPEKWNQLIFLGIVTLTDH